MARVVSAVKQLVLPAGPRVRTIKFGPMKGISLHIDLSHQTQIYLGLYERETFKWFTRLSQGIETAMDIGACYGEYTLFMLLRTSAKRVIAFEPWDERYVDLCNNLRLNMVDRDPRLTIIRKYVNSYLDKNEVTLDSLSNEITGPVFAKMDVDTLETKILRGGKEFLKAHDVRWVIETHSIELEQETLALLQEAGYTTRVIKNAWWRVFIPELRPIAHNRWLVAAKDPNLIR